jgi:hypothetical protein
VRQIICWRDRRAHGTRSPESGERFTWNDPCIQTDPHTGYNEAAASAARIAVEELRENTIQAGTVKIFAKDLPLSRTKIFNQYERSR